MLKKKAIGALVAAATLLSGFAFASLPPVALASTGSGDTNQTVHSDSDVIQFKSENFKIVSLSSMGNAHAIKKDGVITYGEARAFAGDLDLGWDSLDLFRENRVVSNISDLQYFPNVTSVELGEFNNVSDFSPLSHLKNLTSLEISLYNGKKDLSTLPQMDSVKHFTLHASRLFPKVSNRISDFSFISKMPNLETLDLGGDISVSNLNFLSGLKNLKKNNS